MVKDGFNISIPGIFLEEDRVRRGLEKQWPNCCKKPKSVAKICQNMPKYAKICQNMPKYAKICRNMPKYAKLL
jgi:hypothetical protein